MHRIKNKGILCFNNVKGGIYWIVNDISSIDFDEYVSKKIHIDALHIVIRNIRHAKKVTEMLKRAIFTLFQ